MGFHANSTITHDRKKNTKHLLVKRKVLQFLVWKTTRQADFDNRATPFHLPFYGFFQRVPALNSIQNVPEMSKLKTTDPIRKITNKHNIENCDKCRVKLPAHDGQGRSSRFPIGPTPMELELARQLSRSFIQFCKEQHLVSSTVPWKHHQNSVKISKCLGFSMRWRKNLRNTSGNGITSTMTRVPLVYVYVCPVCRSCQSQWCWRTVQQTIKVKIKLTHFADWFRVSPTDSEFRRLLQSFADWFRVKKESLLNKFPQKCPQVIRCLRYRINLICDEIKHWKYLENFSEYK